MKFRHDHTNFLYRYLWFGFIPFYSDCSRKEWECAMKQFKHGNSDGAVHQITFSFPLGFEMLSYNSHNFKMD
jgi:hypothetical protein